MQNFATNVVNFHLRVLDDPCPFKVRSLSPTQIEFNSVALGEEIREFMEAGEKQDVIGQIDAIIDLMYFAVGALHQMGLTPSDMDICSQVIHAANMAKKSGVNLKRGNGIVPDAVKPEGWESPEKWMTDYFKWRMGQ